MEYSSEWLLWWSGFCNKFTIFYANIGFIFPALEYTKSPTTKMIKVHWDDLKLPTSITSHFSFLPEKWLCQNNIVHPCGMSVIPIIALSRAAFLR